MQVCLSPSITICTGVAASWLLADQPATVLPVAVSREQSTCMLFYAFNLCAWLFDWCASLITSSSLLSGTVCTQEMRGCTLSNA